MSVIDSETNVIWAKDTGVPPSASRARPRKGPRSETGRCASTRDAGEHRSVSSNQESLCRMYFMSRTGYLLIDVHRDRRRQEVGMTTVHKLHRDRGRSG